MRQGKTWGKSTDSKGPAERLGWDTESIKISGSRRVGRRWPPGPCATCFPPEAEGAEGALSMPDVEMGNQLATAVIHVLPAWGRDRDQEGPLKGLGRHEDLAKAGGPPVDGHPRSRQPGVYATYPSLHTALSPSCPPAASHPSSTPRSSPAPCDLSSVTSVPAALTTGRGGQAGRLTPAPHAASLPPAACSPLLSASPHPSRGPGFGWAS